ncbi:hypothetical protein ABZP36_015804 [Zizania latifolia]
MAQPRSPDASACLSLLLFLVLPTATATSYSSLCSFPAETAELVAGNRSLEDQALYSYYLPYDGYCFSGGDELFFASDSNRPHHSFFFSFPRRVARTTNPDILHLVTKVTLFGYRHHFERERRSNLSSHSVPFVLEGYYSITPDSAAYVMLCMVGSGSRARDFGSGVVILPDVVLRLQLPRPTNLTRPFITGGRLKGQNFGPVTLVAYAKGPKALFRGMNNMKEN